MPPVSTKNPWTRYIPFYLILSILFLIVYYQVFDAKLALLGDNATYYKLGINLSEGKGFTINGNPHNHFPPGYPFLMSLFMRLGISSLEAMKILNGVFLLISGFLTFQIAQRFTKNAYLSVLVAAIVLLNRHLLEFSTMIMSEVSFMMFTLFSIYLYLKVREKEYSLKTAYPYLLIAALIMTLFIRSLGISIVFAILIDLLIKKQFKLAGITLIIVFFTQLPWQMRSNSLGGNSYMKQIFSINPYDKTKGEMKFNNWVHRFKKNTGRYISKELPSAIFPATNVEYKDLKTAKNIKSPMKHWILGFIIIILGLLGIWSIKEFRVFLLLLFVSFCGILLLWPEVWTGIRFFLPLIPLTTLFMVIGVAYIFSWIIKKEISLKARKRLAFLTIPLLFFQCTPIKQLKEKSEMEYPKNWANYFEMGTWSKENLPKDAKLCSRKPLLMMCISQVESARYKYTTNRKEQFDFLDENNFTHVVIGQLGYNQTKRFIVPLLQKEPDKFKLVYSKSIQKVKYKNGKVAASPYGAWLFEYNSEFGYQGPYTKDGLREGKGVYKYRNNNVLEGIWKNDTLNGPGKLTIYNGAVYEGTWKNGKKHGTFTIRKNNSLIESEWVNDTIQEFGYTLDSDGNRVKQIKLK